MKRPGLSPIAALFGLACLAGCGSGGSSGLAPAPVATAAPTATPTAPSGSKQASAVVKIVIPRGESSSNAKRTPNYVSPNSTQFSSTINTIDGSTTLPAGVARTTVVALSTAVGGNCVVAPMTETCTITIPSPAGTDNFTFTLLGAGNDPLSTQTKTFVIVPATANALSVQLLGIVASLTIGDETVTAGTTASDTLTIEATDASGAQISGTFAAPVTLADGDTSGASSLATNAGTAGTSTTYAAASDSVVLAYNGTAIPSFVITASPIPVLFGAVTVTIHAIKLAGTTTDSGSMSDPNFGDPTLFFSTVPQTEPVTASETGYAGTFTLDTSACGTGPTAFATFATTDNLTFSVTSQNVGLCKVTVSDTLSQSVSFYVSVNTGTIVIDHRTPRRR
jgi:hypothetical protein